MIKFKSVSIRNFLSYGNVPTIVQLDRPGTTLILGEDLDNTTSGTGANGVGKSTLINALTYALYDKPISNISKDNLVNNINKKNMEVVLDFDVDGCSYQITRTRKTKSGAAGNGVLLLRDGKDITPDSVSNTNTEVERILGMPYDLFVRIVTFTATLTPFLDLPVRSQTGPNQTDIIEDLFDLKTLSDKADVLKDKIRATDQSIETQMVRIDQINRELTRHATQVESAQGRVVSWNIQNKRDVADISKKLEKIDNIDIDEQQQLYQQAQGIEKQLQSLRNSDKDTQKQIDTLTKQLSTTKGELIHLEDAKCPYCKQKYHDTTEKISGCRELMTEVQEALTGLLLQKRETESLINTSVVELNDTRARLVVADVKELLDIKGKATHYQERLEGLKTAVNPFEEPLQELLEMELDQPDMSNINKLKRLSEHQKFLQKLLTKKDSFVRKALLNKYLPFLNQRLSLYVTELGLPHVVEFTHDMTAKITQFGRDLDFGNLSNGQRARVNIALSLAFRDVLQSVHTKINVCMLDEVLDVGLDSVGVQAAARMLKRKARDEQISMFIISHRDEVDNAFDRKLVVQLSKGFSYIRYEDD